MISLDRFDTWIRRNISRVRIGIRDETRLKVLQVLLPLCAFLRIHYEREEVRVTCKN